MQLEQDFMNHIAGGTVNNILDLNRVYVENIRNIFIESMNWDWLLLVNISLQWYSFEIQILRYAW